MPLFLLSVLCSLSIFTNSFLFSYNEPSGRETLELVNTIRTQGCTCGSTYYAPVPALQWNEVLTNTAMEHSKDMAKHQYFSHADRRGNRADKRLDKNAYPWKSYGENIYKNTNPRHTAEDAVQAWKDSEVHCINMMRPYFTEMGVAHYKGYWTQLFGSR